MKKFYKKLECEIMLWAMDVVTASGETPDNGDGPQGYDPDGTLSGGAETWPW